MAYPILTTGWTYFPRNLGEVHEEKNGATVVGSKSAWMRRHFNDSIYLWACGEKADDEDHDSVLSDRLIGWLVLFVSGSGSTCYVVYKCSF